MRSRPTFEASVVVLATLLAWWVVVLALDGALTATFPYDRYETFALLYPDAFYPGIPGLLLAEFLAGLGLEALFGGRTFFVGVVGWLILLAAAVGTGVARLASRRGRSPTATAAATVGGLVVVVSLLEAVATLVP